MKLDQFKGNSVVRPDGILAIFRKTNEAIAKLLTILLRQSIDKSSIAVRYEKAYEHNTQRRIQISDQIDKPISLHCT